MDTRFTSKVAIITGVNDRGIGGAVSERLGDEGAALGILWHQRPDRLISRLQKRGIPFFDAKCDVTIQSEVNSAIDACMSEFGQIDILVNNAGVEVSKELENTTDDDWHRLIDVNLTGAMRMTRACLPVLTEPDGVIINIASVLGIAGCVGFPAYSASKAGLIGMTQSLAMELAPRGIRALCVAPALVHTPMIKKYVSNMNSSSQSKIATSHPLGIGTSRDVANAVAFLASEEARWVTGITLPMGWATSFPLPMEDLMPAIQQNALDTEAAWKEINWLEDPVKETVIVEE